MSGPGIDLGARAVSEVSAIMALRLEKASADIARAAGNYGSNNKVTLSGTSQWSDSAMIRSRTSRPPRKPFAPPPESVPTPW